MKKLLNIATLLVFSGLCLLPSLALAKSPGHPDLASGVFCPPPRFQVIEARGQYGGLMLLDSKTGETFQRVIVNTKNGVSIRWLKIPRDQPLRPGETILWGAK